MPELPEVELVRRRIETGVLGSRIEEVQILDLKRLDSVSPERLKDELKGKTFIKVGRIGKQLLLGTEAGVLAIHLGLTGDVVIGTSVDRLPRFARLIVRFEDGRRMVFEDMRRFGRVGFARSVDEIVARKRLGPDVMVVSSRTFAERARRHKRAIKSVLLDQSVVSGIGNLYADEALFQAGIHPQTLASFLSESELRNLHRCAKRVMGRSLTVGSDFDLLPRTYLLRNRREGEVCPGTNGARLASITVGGRTTVYCPRKQRLRRAPR
ncbi:MAG: DNA-formamidopyrimidine glycosylase family protein [Methanomassiliicoccales archaeon]|jgi:formamidopyrimidine-DNA glycosylase